MGSGLRHSRGNLRRAPRGRWARRAAISLLTLLPVVGARAAHPLITEDAYTLGSGVSQLEIGAEEVRFDEPGLDGRVSQVRPVFSHGLRDDVDILVGAPYLDTRESSLAGVERTRGLGDVSVELKWRFHDDGRTKLALKPGFTLTTGNFDKGLGTGRSVPSVFLVSTFERAGWYYNLHTGYLRNNNKGELRKDLFHLSGSAVVRASPRVQWAVDVSADSSVDRQESSFPVVALAAVIYSPLENLDLDLGMRVGLNSAADDRAFLAGVTVRW